MSMRLVSSLPEVTEVAIRRVIGCAIEVHRRLGPGLLEGIYHDAMVVELAFQGLSFQTEQVLRLRYRDHPLRPQRIDLIVERQVIVELKAAERLAPLHRAQVISYLRASGLRAGLLINFNSQFVKNGIERIVL
jgi:GxxExxY protein